MNYKAQTGNQKNLVFSLKFWALTISLILFYTTLIFAQNVVYIDPTTTDPIKNGTMDYPYDSWQSFSIQSNTTYLTKRGTSFQLHVSRIEIDNKVNVTFGAYGVGERPIIYSRNSNAFMMMVKRSNNVVIRDLHFTKHPANTIMPSGIYISGHNSGSTPTTNTSIINCEISYCWGGVRGMPFSTGISDITIDSCLIHHIDDDGVFIVDCDNVTVKNSHIYLVNLNFWKVGVTHNEAPGDCVHLVNDCNNYLIENNILDRRHTGNKFAFIYGNTGYRPVRGRVIGNTIYPPKDTIGDGGGSGLYFSGSQYVEIAYNKWIGRGYDTKPVSAAHITPDTVLFYYNSLDSVHGVSFLMSIDHLKAFNNTLISNADVSFGMLLSGIPSGEVRNNIVAVKSGNRIQNTNSNGVIQSNNALFQGTPNNWNNDIGIVDWSGGNFNLTPGSVCIDAGYDYNGYHYDMNNIPAPQGTSRDIGAFEFPQGGAINNPPVIQNQTFSVEENSPGGAIVGTILAVDPDNGQTLTYTIVSGNTGSTFAVSASTGQVTVANNTLLDFETNPVFNLTVQVADNGIPVMTDQAVITINLLDVNEAPVMNDQTFSVEQFSPNGTSVGTIAATDPDNGQTLTFSIISGNTGGTFAVNPSSGLMTVADNTLLDFAINPVFVLSVQAEDNGTPLMSDQATITIELFAINQPPIVNDQAFQVDENSTNGTIVGTILAVDPDNGQTLTYTIVSGNTGSTFAVSASTGQVTVANNTLLDFETNPVFNLTVQVADNGIPVMTDQAVITINLLDVNEAPDMENQSFSLAQFSPNGTEVGAIAATDPDNGQTLTFSIVSGNTGNTFAINSSSGLITVADNTLLDMSTNPVFVLSVEVEDNGIPLLSDQADITINLYATNQSPVMNDQTFQVDENSANGTLVGTILAVDPDNGQTLTYTILSGNTGSTFAVSASTGQVTVANNTLLDFETNPVFNLTVQVADNGIPVMTDQASITINLLDVNEAPVMTDQNFSVEHFSPNGTNVGTIAASDPDNGQSLTFSILSGNTGNTFAINPSSGLITVADNTLLDITINPVFVLIVEVEDNGTPVLSDQANITIELFAINQPPVMNDQTFQIDENSPNGTLIGTIVAADPDNGQTLTYTVLSGNIGNTFSVASATGQISVANNALLDFETSPVFTLNIEVADNGIPVMTDQAIITINLLDVNEAPEMNDQTYSIQQFSPNGTQVGTIVATDPDFGQTLTFSILSGNTGNTFAIDPLNGLITVADNTLLDMSINPVFVLTVKVEDNGSPVLSNQANMIIYLYDINHPPVINNQTFDIEENSPNGTLVGLILADDPNTGQELTYSIISGNTGNTFAVSATTGQISVADNTLLDFESNPVFTLNIEVADNGVPVLTDQAIITINLLDVNEAPVINNQILEVSFDAIVIFLDSTQVIHPVGYVVATDPDEAQSLSYTIISGNESGLWEIDSETGEICLANESALNLVAFYSYPIVVEVTDNAPEPLSAVATVTIDVTLLKLAEYLEIIGSLGILEAANFSNNEFKISLYPNPAIDNLSIEMNDLNTIESPLEITILNLSGEVLVHQVYYTTTARFSEKIDVSRLSKGMYMVVVQHGKVTKYGKFLKH